MTWWTADWQLRLMASAEQHHLADELGRIWTPTDRSDRAFLEGATGPNSHLGQVRIAKPEYGLSQRP